MVKEAPSSFWTEALTHSFKRDIPIIAYLVYLYFGVLKYGLSQMRETIGFGGVGVLVLLIVILLPAVFVGIRVWRT